MKKNACLLLIWILGLSAIAQEDSIPVITLDAVELKLFRSAVSQEKTPFAISQFSFSNIDPPRPEGSLDAFLAATPGLFIQNSSNYAQDSRISIRGFGSRAAFGIRGIKLIVDGLPETTPDGQGQVDNLTLGLIRNIEVLRGAQSALYGNASGGVILINTLDFDPNASTTAGLRMGSYGLQQQQIATQFATPNQQWMIHAGRFKTDGYRSFSQMLSHQLQLKGKFDRPNDAQWNWQLNYTDSPYARDAGGLTLEEVKNNRKQARDRNVQFQTEEAVQQLKTGLAYRKKEGDRLFNSYAFFNHRIFDAFLPLNDGGAVALQRSYFGQGASWQIPFLPQRGQGTLRLGFDWAVQNDARKRYDNNFGKRDAATLDQIEIFQNLGMFALGQWMVGASNWMAGLRYDTNILKVNDRFLVNGNASDRILLNALNPSLGWHYDYKKGGSLFANFSTAFETPALSELSADPLGTGGFNNDLKPQKSTTYEMGWRIKKADVETELVVFWIKTKDELTPYELAAFNGRTFYQNAGSTDRKGVEFFHKRKLSTYLTARISYTFADLKFDAFLTENNDFSGNVLPGIPKHTSYGQLNYTGPAWQGQLALQYRGDFFADNSNAVAVDNVLLIDLSLQRTITLQKTRLTPYFGIQNLMNQDYFDNIRINAFGGRFYEPAAGRQLYLGIKFAVK